MTSSIGGDAAPDPLESFFIEFGRLHDAGGSEETLKDFFVKWLTRSGRLGVIHSRFLLQLQIESLQHPSLAKLLLRLIEEKVSFFAPYEEIAKFFVFLCRAEVHRANGEMEAIDWYRSAEKQLIEHCPEHIHIQRKAVLFGESEFFRLNHQFPDALDRCRQIIAIDKMCENARDIAVDYCNEANLILDAEDDAHGVPFWEIAENTIQRAEQLIATLPSTLIPELHGTVCGLRGKAAMIKGDYPAALIEFESAKEIFRKARKPERIGRTWRFIGLAHRAMGNHEEAMQAFQSSFLMLEPSGAMLDKKSTLADRILARAPRSQEWDPTIFEGFAIVRNFQDSIKEKIAYELYVGEYCSESGDFEKSQHYLNEALASASTLNLFKERSSSCIALARLARRRGNNVESRTLIASCKSLALASKNRLGLEIESELQGEEFLVDQAISITSDNASVISQLAMIRKLESAVDSSLSRNFNYCDRLARLRGDYAAWTCATGNAQECLLHIENAHCDLSNGMIDDDIKSSTAPRHQTWDQLAADLSAIAEIHGENAGVKIVSMIESDGFLLVATMWSDHGCWEVNVRRFKQKDIFDIKKRLGHFVAGIGNQYFENLNRHYIELSSLARNFIEEILAPFPAAPSKTEYLYVIPHKRWHQFPFEMLIRTFGKNFGREGISRIASIKALAQACSRAQKDRRFSGALAITAGRNLSTGKVAYRSIKKAFGPLTDMLPSDDKERLLPSNFIPKASDCSIFHISSHGFFNTRYPSCSLIDLASGSEDGSWSLADVVRELRFRNAPIVMMSACEVGTIGTDEGRDFIGFAGAFLDAGASACIGSRFKINEISTVIMLDRFYTALHNDITLNGFCRPGFALSTAIASVRSMTRDEIEIFFNEAIGEAGLTEEKATLLKDNKMTLYQFCTGSHPLDNDALWTGFSSYGLCVFPLTLAGKAS